MRPSVFHVASRTGYQHASWQAYSRHFWNWAMPPLPGAVRLRPRTIVGPETESGTLRDALERDARLVHQAWRAAVLRRALCVSAAIGLILALVDAWLGWPRWCAPVAAAVVAVVTTAAAWRQAPGLDAVARFLDHALGLKEQLSTALDVDTRALSSSTVGVRLNRQATAAARGVSAAWEARGVRVGREWAAVAVLLGILAAAVILPSNRVPAAPEAAPSTAPVVVGPAAGAPADGARPLAVRVAVVSSQNASGAPAASTAHHAASTTSHAATLHHTPAVSSTQTTGEVRRRKGGTSRPPNGASADGKKLPAPVLRHSENALPAGPASPGKKGAFSSRTPANQGPTRPTTAGRGAAAGSGAHAVGATKHSQTGGPSTSQKGAGTGAGSKPGSGAGSKPGSAAHSKTTQTSCLYGCAHILPSQLSAPGLITGKGQFAGKGLPGSQTTGHAAGAAPTLGSAKAATPKTARQLTITSAYQRANGTQVSTKQVQGHNGAGGTAPSVVQAGKTGGATFDYVQPDANVQDAANDVILGRYFTPSPAS